MDPAASDTCSVKPSASLGRLSPGNCSPNSSRSASSLNNTSSNNVSSRTTSSDSGEKTLNSDSTSLYIYTGGHRFFTSDEEEEDWSISENATSGVTHFAYKEPLYIPTFRLMTALDIWIQEIRGQTEIESPTPMINKPLNKSSSSCT
ncbi:hypothetical protein Aperf_G00000012926 [Anoplocephala perfoliata]